MNKTSDIAVPWVKFICFAPGAWVKGFKGFGKDIQSLMTRAAVYAAQIFVSGRYSLIHGGMLCPEAELFQNIHETVRILKHGHGNNDLPCMLGFGNAFFFLYAGERAEIVDPVGVLAATRTVRKLLPLCAYAS